MQISDLVSAFYQSFLYVYISEHRQTGVVLGRGIKIIVSTISNSRSGWVVHKMKWAGVFLSQSNYMFSPL